MMAEQKMTVVNRVPDRTIFFSMTDYDEFEQSLMRSRRARYLFIQGRGIVDIDHRAAESRDQKLCVGRFTLKNLPHYEGLLSRIEKVAYDYEQEV